MIKSYKNIIFDLGNVLVDIDYQATYDAIYTLLPSGDEEHIEKIGKQYEVGDFSTSVFLNKLMRMGDSRIQALDVIKAWNAMLISIPKSKVELVQELNKDRNIFILSNTNHLHIEWTQMYLRKHFGIKSFSEIVDEAFYSHCIKASKPDEKAFHAVIEKTGISPEDTVFIDDKIENVEAARKCNIDAVHLKDPEDLYGLFKG